MKIRRCHVFQIAGVIASVITLIGGSSAEEGPVTAGDLRGLCAAAPIASNTTAPARTLDELTVEKAMSECTFYVAGVVNLLLLPAVADAVQVCVPNDMTMEQLRLNIERMMRDDPNELRDHSAAFAITSALRAHYPCK
jgi:hypothetical protein